MVTVERMTITVPSEMAETLRQMVMAGEYASISEVIREALCEWMRQREAEQHDLKALQVAIKVGLDSGPGLPADQVLAELLARYAGQA